LFAPEELEDVEESLEEIDPFSLEEEDAEDEEEEDDDDDEKVCRSSDNSRLGYSGAQSIGGP